MKILGIDSTAKSASAAVTENARVLSSFYINTGLTHSQTLMPMVNDVLRYAEISLDDIDLIAVNKGPGSFTGVRIGVAAVKGIADAKDILCVGISTLESMAYNLIDIDCIACCAMNARCNQVYAALFEISGGKAARLTEDSAISVAEFAETLKKYEKKKILVGDGADMCYNLCKDVDNVCIAGENAKYQNAVSVCLAAQTYGAESYVKAAHLLPEYLRLPQAERELNNRLNNKGV